MAQKPSTEVIKNGLVIEKSEKTNSPSSSIIFPSFVYNSVLTKSPIEYRSGFGCPIVPDVDSSKW